MERLKFKILRFEFCSNIGDKSIKALLRYYGQTLEEFQVFRNFYGNGSIITDLSFDLNNEENIDDQTANFLIEEEKQMSCKEDQLDGFVSSICHVNQPGQQRNAHVANSYQNKAIKDVISNIKENAIKKNIQKVIVQEKKQEKVYLKNDIDQEFEELFKSSNHNAKIYERENKSFPELFDLALKSQITPATIKAEKLEQDIAPRTAHLSNMMKQITKPKIAQTVFRQQVMIPKAYPALKNMRKLNIKYSRELGKNICELISSTFPYLTHLHLISCPIGFSDCTHLG